MPDFKSEIRAAITGLNLSPEREVEIVEELSQHLEEHYEDAVSRGASEEEAKCGALEGLTVPDSLGNELKQLKHRVPPRLASPGFSVSQVATQRQEGANEAPQNE
jgi:hypothetical protein